MRPTIGRKVALALSAVVSLGLLAMVLIYEGLGECGGSDAPIRAGRSTVRGSPMLLAMAIAFPQSND